MTDPEANFDIVLSQEEALLIIQALGESMAPARFCNELARRIFATAHNAKKPAAVPAPEKEP